MAKIAINRGFQKPMRQFRIIMFHVPQLIF